MVSKVSCFICTMLDRVSYVIVISTIILEISVVGDFYKLLIVYSARWKTSRVGI